MGVKSFLGKQFAQYVRNQTIKWSSKPAECQSKIFNQLIDRAKNTMFGKDHNFKEMTNYDDFKKNVPVRDYESLKSYFDEITLGKHDILWPGVPLYLSKTSGTTSGVKYIPITKDSISNHFESARNAVLNYIDQTGNSHFLDGKLIFLSGSPKLNKLNGIHVGRLSGIVNHHIPSYLRTNQMPSYKTNCIEDWEEKLEAIVDETLNQNMTLISGIPPWVQMYLDKIKLKSGKNYVKEVFKNFSLFVYGGVNFEPYKAKLFETIGKKIDSIETYPASEGFIAYQDSQYEEGLLILLNSGIFYEFIPIEEYFEKNPKRLMITEIELGKNYAIILNSNAGLWGYSIGDTVKFVSKSPYRLVVTGRVKHFISAFGEHVIGEEVEKSMKFACSKFPETELIEFTVAPNVTPKNGLPLHEWYIEFAKEPNSLDAFQKELNSHLQRLNIYYNDLIEGNILGELKIIKLPKNSFVNYMKYEGKLGGQNKVPRLANDRKIADWLLREYLK